MDNPRYVTSPPDGEQVVAMTVFKDTIYVATTKGVYMLVDGALKPLDWVEPTAGT